MRVQHNIMAMNSYRNYSNNVKSLSGNLEKLSSGYKINRAGDDAAGLAISEKMRAQITGLEAAQKNVKDGISLVKTAEGAMQEIQDMLNRMDYLATQSANGTYQNEVDRENLQKEVEALKTEINRIADSANFNGIKLLDGSLGEGTSSTSIEGMMDISVTGKKDAQLAGKSAQAGKWELDLSKYSFTSSDKTSQFVIKVGGTAVATVSIAASGTTAGSDVKVATTTSVIALGGASVNVRFENGKLTVEMLNTPTTSGTAAAAKGVGMVTVSNLAVSVDDGATGNTVAKVSINVNGSTTAGTGLAGTAMASALQLSTVTEARAEGDKRLYGTAKFTLTSNHLKDGMTLKIGNESYTLAIGQDSKFKNGKNVIDLTDMTEKEASTTGAKTLAVGQRITEAFKNNSQFEVRLDEASAGNLKFILVEKEGSGLDYIGSPIVGDKSGAKLAGDASWRGIVQYGQASTDTSGGGGLMLQIGDTADAFNQMRVKVGDMHVAALGIEGIDIGNQEGAAAAVAKIKDAINSVSSVRGDLGAIQNRLDHTANNLSVMAENIQDAESTIRDTDVAEEMMSYVKNNILIQSAQAMLAQANQVPQGVLQLLG